MWWLANYLPRRFQGCTELVNRFVVDKTEGQISLSLNRNILLILRDPPFWQVAIDERCHYQIVRHSTANETRMYSLNEKIVHVKWLVSYPNDPHHTTPRALMPADFPK